MISQIFLISVVSTLLSFLLAMFIGNAVLSSYNFGPVIVLLAMLIGTIIGCSVAIINTINNKASALNGDDSN